ncbi:NUDIX domain-containing protein [Verrucosispora sp. WMMD703]|uniref:NUDIX domain-containing protein n=1 Tax=Verrucosispora sp. WMMD703 TaxID=3403463 RepID=UPI003B967279
MDAILTSLDQLGRTAERDGLTCVVGAVIRDPDGRVYLQRRAPHVRLFPGCWDIVGGHVEPGETLPAALAREVTEETGWRLDRITDVVHVFDWTGADGQRRREVDVLATADGDLGQPRLEAGKFTEGRWFDEKGLQELLTKEKASGDAAMIKLALRALTSQQTRPEGTVLPLTSR